MLSTHVDLLVILTVRRLRWLCAARSPARLPAVDLITAAFCSPWNPVSSCQCCDRTAVSAEDQHSVPVLSSGSDWACVADLDI